MSGVEARLARSLGAEQRLRLALEAADPVDLTIIDCPGSLGILTVSAMVAADHVLTVAMPTIKELAGLPKIAELVEQVRVAYRPRLGLLGIVPCLVPPWSQGRHYGEALNQLRTQWPSKVTSPIRRAVAVPESYAARTPIPVYAPAAGVSADYVRAAAGWFPTPNSTDRTVMQSITGARHPLGSAAQVGDSSSHAA